MKAKEREFFFFSEMCFVLFKLLLTKFHRLGSLNYKNVFLPVMKAGKVEIRVPDWFASVKSDSCDPMDCNLPGSSESMRFSRQEYWSGLPFLTPGDLPDPRIEPASPMSPALTGSFFTTSATWEAW